MKDIKSKIAAEIAKLSPMQKESLKRGLFGPAPDPNDFVRAMHFGGDYTIDDDRRMVEMSGDFSRADLLKIAAVMID